MEHRGVDKIDVIVYILNLSHKCRCTPLRSSSVYSVFALLMTYLPTRVNDRTANDSRPMEEETSLLCFYHNLISTVYIGNQ